MNNSHRVGTLTLGVMLIVYGALFLVKIFVPAISFKLLFSLWPVILIMLGLEVIGYNFFNKEDKIKYDIASFFLIVLMSGFSFAMGIADCIISRADIWSRVFC